MASVLLFIRTGGMSSIRVVAITREGFWVWVFDVGVWVVHRVMDICLYVYIGIGVERGFQP